MIPGVSLSTMKFALTNQVALENVIYVRNIDDKRQFCGSFYME